MRRIIPLLLCTVLSAISHADESQCDNCTDLPAVAVEATYTGEMWRQVSGGIATGNRYLDNLELTIDVDGARAFDAEGLQFFSSMLYNNGRALADDFSGALQGVSNIETTKAFRLFELWAEWRSDRKQQSLRLGLYDLNSEFDAIDTAGLFINPSHGIGPDFAQSGRSGPSIFPVTSLALRAQKSAGPWSLQAAVLDGAPHDSDHLNRKRVALSDREGALLVGEVNYRLESGLRVGSGYWRYTAGFDDLRATSTTQAQRHDNAGAYLIVESPTLLAGEAGRGLNLFFRTGEAESRINTIGSYYGAGAVYSGVFLPRLQDQLGVAVAIARVGGPSRLVQEAAGLDSDCEYNYELTYRLGITQRLALQLDVQYIENPGMSSAMPAAWVVGLRMVADQRWSR